MAIIKLEHCTALGPIYEDTGNSLGFFCIHPGYPPFICLSKKLQNGPEIIHQFVFNILLAYHKTIPKDSKLLVSGHVCFLEELVSPDGMPLPEPEIIFIGRAIRIWNFFPSEEARVIGKAG